VHGGRIVKSVRIRLENTWQISLVVSRVTNDAVRIFHLYFSFLLVDFELEQLLVELPQIWSS